MADQDNISNNNNRIKDTEDWTTGGEPATKAQLDYLNALGEDTSAGNLTKAQASELIDRLKQERPEQLGKIKDPGDWNTGEDSASGAQKSYLKTLANEAGEDVDTNITKAEAANKIEELQKKTGKDKV